MGLVKSKERRIQRLEMQVKKHESNSEIVKRLQNKISVLKAKK